jgi:cell wall-associated NlpC family hydrolase
MADLDPRRHAHRPDLADARLKGHVNATRFAEGTIMQVRDPLVSLRRAPHFDAMQLTQALLGEMVRVFQSEEGWAWAQLQRDGYVGYLSTDALSPQLVAPTHRVSVPSTFLYPAPDIKSQPATSITLNAEVAVAGGDPIFARLADGRFIIARHLKPLGDYASDFVAIAEQFVHVPYYWGGKSVMGLDCSGLVQVSLQACGHACPRDSDMQEQELGRSLPPDRFEQLQRGDLVFWNGHVGIMRDQTTLLHANGFHMQVVSEPLAEAVKRIAASYGPITAIKRT